MCNIVEFGWRAKVTPSGHPVNHYEFDVLVGGDGKRNTLAGNCAQREQPNQYYMVVE